jgi:hypothetical protein
MALYLPAVYKPVVNHSGARTGRLGFVVHVQVGDGSCFAEFDRSSSQASSHFWISKSGVVEQYVETDLVAWAEMAGNGSYLSCEFEGLTTEAMTAAQLAAGAALIAWCATQDGFPLVGADHGGTGVTTHCHYPSGVADPAWGDHSCPGPIRLAQIPQLIAMAAAVNHGTPEVIMGTFNTEAFYLQPGGAPDAEGRLPHWQIDAAGNWYAFNGAPGLPNFSHYKIDPGSVIGGVAGGQVLPDGKGVVFAVDNGAAQGGEPGGYAASTYAFQAG